MSPAAPSRLRQDRDIAYSIPLRSERVIIRALAYMRGAQYIPFVIAASVGDHGAYHHPNFVYGLYALSAAWSVLLFTIGWRGDGIRAPWIAADIGFAAAATILVGFDCAPGGSVGWDNWTVGPCCGAATIAAMYLRPRIAAVGVGVVAIAYLVGTGHNPGVSNTPPPMLGNAFSIIAFAMVGGLIASFLRSSAREAESALRNERESIVVEERTRARFDERTRQYGQLHDTVLQTLSMIARGGLDFRAAQVQTRCANDAEYLRGLISGSAKDLPTDIGTALADLARQGDLLGLDIRVQFDDLPDAVPPAAVEAIALAVRECLNNVAKHAKTTRAWLTATGDGSRGIRVTVVDRGVGFDPSHMTSGFGTVHSLTERLGQVGATVSISSWPEDGTRVEIVWAP